MKFTTGGQDYNFIFDPTAGNPAILAENTPAGTVYYIREPGGELIARVSGSDIFYYQFDELGSTRLITDDSGAVTDRFTYDAYGAVLSHNCYAGSIDQPYQYVGRLGYYTHYMQPEFGWLQLGVRFYDPELGRFERRGSPYTYALNNPLSNVQPEAMLPPRTLPDPKTGEPRWYPGGNVTRLKYCTRSLFMPTKCDFCLKHSFLLIDAEPRGYGPGGAGVIVDDRNSLYYGGATCKPISVTDKQMSCLLKYKRNPKSVPGGPWEGGSHWRGGDFYFVGPGKNCWEYSHALLAACDVTANIDGPVPWDQLPNFTPPVMGGL